LQGVDCTGGRVQLGEAFELNQSLKRLYAGYTHLLPSDLYKYLMRKTPLEHLLLNANEIGDQEAKIMSEILSLNSRLLVLNLSNNKITDDGAMHIGSALKVNSTLQSLHLSYNSIRIVGINFLQTALQINEVLTLLTTYSLDFITEVPQIEEYLQRNKESIRMRRNRLVRSFIILVKDETNGSSNSQWVKFPKELRNYIIKSLTYLPFETIGRQEKQINNLFQFLRNNIPPISARLQQGFRFEIQEDDQTLHLRYLQ
jgi:hypothetical protein